MTDWAATPQSPVETCKREFEMQRMKILGLIALTLGLLLSSVNQAFSQEDEIAEAIPAAEPAESTPKVRPLTVAAGLVDEAVITGTLIDSTAIGIKTAFGEASIPLSEVAGIRFPAAEDSSTTIVMLNGDSITGVTDLKYANVETTWGSAKINGQNIATMLFVPGLRWESIDALGGKRWTLIEATAPQAVNRAVQPASGVQPAPRVQQGRPQVIFGR